MSRLSLGIYLAISTLLLVPMCLAQPASTTVIPNLIRYSGTLRDAQGVALASSTLGVNFAIYKQQDGGAPSWQETQNVVTDASGNYTVLLGSTTATGLPTDLFSQQEQHWLGVQVLGDAEQSRVLIVSVPYAFQAHEAELLGGLPASAFVQAPSTSASGVPGSGAPSSASQNAAGSGNSASTARSGVGIDTIVNCVGAQNGRISVFTGAAPPNITLCNSGIYEATPYGTGAIGVLNPNPIVALDVTGSINASLDYQIGESTVLTIASPADNNLFLGVGSGSHNKIGKGIQNTFAGYQAGFSNGIGSDNTFSGYQAGYNNKSGGGNASYGSQAGFSNTTGAGNTFTGFWSGVGNTTGNSNTFTGALAGFYNITNSSNTFTGYEAGYNNTQDGNTFTGYQAGYSNTTGAENDFDGYQAGYANTTGNYNTFIGYGVGSSNTSGGDNTFIGNEVGYANTTGDNNIFVGGGFSNTSGYFNTFLGYGAGGNNTTGYGNIAIGPDAGISIATGKNNIYIGNVGCLNLCDESNTIRIGGDPYDNWGPQTAAYITGVYGATVDGNGVPVYVDDNGKLGIAVSSRRFKEQITRHGRQHQRSDEAATCYVPLQARVRQRRSYFAIRPDRRRGGGGLSRSGGLRQGRPAVQRSLSVHHHYAAERSGEAVPARRRAGRADQGAAAGN